MFSDSSSNKFNSSTSDPVEPPSDFEVLRFLRDRLEWKSATGAGSRVLTVDQLIAFLTDLPDETGDGNGH